MTLPTSYDNFGDENKSFFSELIDLKYFKNYLKKDRILILIMNICVFILSPLITFFMYANGNISAKTAVDFNRAMYCVIAAVCGILLPLYLYNYNHNRKSSVFFNSLPIKKHTLYNTHALLGLVYFLISVTFNFILVTILILLKHPASDTFTDAVSFHFGGYFVNLIIFAALYCAMIFAANIAGTSLSSAILYAYVNFYLCSWIAIIYLVFEIICSYTTFRVTNDMVFNTSFIMYVISKVSNMSLVQALLILAISSVLYICGIFLNRRQKIEKAERSIYFERFEQVFKYSMLAVATIIVGIAFYQTGKAFGYYIGSLFGGVVGLILMNIITRKNIKEAFYKFRNFIIFFLIITIASVPVILILTFLDTFVPDVNSIEYIETQSSYTNNLYSFRQYGNYNFSEEDKKNYDMEKLFSYNRSMQIKDKNLIETINDMQGIIYSGKYNNDPDHRVTDYGRFSLFTNGFDYKFNNGYRLSKTTRYFYSPYEMFSSSEYKDALYKLISNQEYINGAYYPLFDDKAAAFICNEAFTVYVNLNEYQNAENANEYTPKEFVLHAGEAAKLIEALKKDIINISSDKAKFFTVYEGILENNKYYEGMISKYDEYGNELPQPEYGTNGGNFKEYPLYISFRQMNEDNIYNNAVEIQITINDYFIETLNFIKN